ncbi:hypothetical protein GGR55DRAFT_628737 [Xylaria sp. FL0064]|nr:hypothetical protein GGR55DRAFT_628737 [Xylaria sp. FL0064]
MNSAGVDQFNMLAYDYAGSWDTTAGHQANLYPDLPTLPTLSAPPSLRPIRPVEIVGKRVDLPADVYLEVSL